ncbi:MAG: hypothetical protein DI537_17500 [Stutzerimonas stutzeri]|nr:MAG: hypothetical protein DI537_17500 [Stutzerimonas stutzeri]
MHGPIVYLDFDGVVVTDAQSTTSPRNYLCPSKIALVRDLCDRSGAKVVVSSTWRVSQDCRQSLASAGLPPSYLFADWSTPLTVDDDEDGSIRGLEIDQHVKCNGIDCFVILDDMPVLPRQTPRHVQPDPSVGITKAQIDLAFDLISNPMDDAHA